MKEQAAIDPRRQILATPGGQFKLCSIRLVGAIMFAAA
jgi:hypothetical protein